MPRRRRRGFIILFGTKGVVTNDGVRSPGRCPRCGRDGTLVGKRVRRWFTLFFVPLFPVDGGQTFTQCGQCRASFNGTPRQVAGTVARAEARQTQRAITLYNGLRASPSNSVTLNELMLLHLAEGRPADAVNAAADFPDAVNASEQCMVTLGRAYLAVGQPGEAAKWFDDALSRNPESSEAHFHRAAACLVASPPDLERAIASARAARRTDYPGAAELLATVEAQARGEGA
jgi:predicted Zn-dependent protease